MSSAQGQVAGIFSRRRRPPRTSKTLPGGVQDPVTQSLRLGAGQVAVQGDEPQPGQQGGGD